MKTPRHARSLALLSFGALAAYLSSALLAAPLALWFARLVGPEQIIARVLLGVVALDLLKAPFLIGLAWLLGGSLTLRPTTGAVTLVMLVYAIELLVAVLLDQYRWLGHAEILLSRGAAVAFLIWLVATVLRLRRRGRAVD